MDLSFKVRERKSRLINFMKNLEHSVGVSDWEDEDISKFVHKSFLGKGNEGTVYTSKFKLHSNRISNTPFVSKVVDLKKIEKSKDISKIVLKSTANEIYKLFSTKEAFNKPSLMEMLTMTMTNQLILQNICPHYSMNYYWDVNSTKKQLFMYNELANAGDYDDWATKKHSEEMWFNAFFQIFVGLYGLKKYFNMLHTDFHTNNILVHKVKPGGYWKYIIDGENYYVPNLGYIFLIHDFGFTWIPNGIGVRWHTQNMQKFSRLQKEFFDVNTFLESLWYDDYKTPKALKTVMIAEFEDILEPSRTRSPNSTKDNIGRKIADIYRGRYAGNIDYRKKPKSGKKLETYSMDKEFSAAFLPRNLRQFVQKI